MYLPTILRGAAVAATLLLGSCASDFEITLRNETGAALVPYSVTVTAGQPPQRVADPAGTLAPGAESEIDPEGFNPLYYNAASQVGVLLQLGLDDDPEQILARVLEYSAPPDQPGTTVLLTEELFEPQSKRLLLRVGQTDVGVRVLLDEL